MAFSVWVNAPVAGTNVLSADDFATRANSGVRYGDPARAIDMNSGLRQANLIGVALMNALGITTFDLTSPETDVRSAITNKLKLYQHDVCVHASSSDSLSRASFGFSIVSESSTSIDTINKVIDSITPVQPGGSMRLTPASGFLYFNNTLYHIYGISKSAESYLNMIVYDKDGVMSYKVFNAYVLTNSTVTDFSHLIQIGGQL